MVQQAWKRLKVFTRRASLRQQVAYSLALVRLILVPVILLAVYYLFAMGLIVDRIVRVDAPAATLGERAALQMMDARRAERNYFLLHDPAEIQANRQFLANLDRILIECRELQPEERSAIDKMQSLARLYHQHFEQAVLHAGDNIQAPLERVRHVVRAYQQDLDKLLRHAAGRSRAQLIDDLFAQVGSFDAEVAETMEAEDPNFRRTALEMRAESQEIIDQANELEKRSWDRVNYDHQRARSLVQRAEWVLIIVSALTILLSVWVSFILPRQVVTPLTNLKQAVDHAAAGNYEIEFDVHGEGEVAQLANSVRNLIDHVREKRTKVDA